MGRPLVIALAAAALVAGCGDPSVTPAPGARSAPASAEQDDHETTATQGNAHCGVERWAVKTGSDPDVGQINLTKPPTPTTVAALTALRPPSLIPPNGRIMPTETTVYTLHATLTGYKQESDSDYHLVLSDGKRTMIAEIPLPACTAPDPLKAGITNARKEFTALYIPDPTMKHVAVPVTVTGIGFDDYPHNQFGAASNSIELHPVIDIRFG